MKKARGAIRHDYCGELRAPRHCGKGEKRGTVATEPTITRQEVAHLAYLARLDVTDEELDRYAGQLDLILHSVAAVSAVADQDIEPTSHAVPLVNVYREDVVRPGLTNDEALAMAPAADAGMFRVPQILGEEQ